MTPEQLTSRQQLQARIRELIVASDHGREYIEARDRLLWDLGQYQQRWVPAYHRFCAQQPPSDLPPALPTDAFRFARISSRDECATVRAFESSGTTKQERSLHHFADLTLYDLAAERAARVSLFPDRKRIRLMVLAPREDELPSSSLSYMLARFMAWFGTEASRYIWPIDAHGAAAFERELRSVEREGEPVALLGTSFAFVHVLDALGDIRFRLASGSRIMQTGGFKGKAREVLPEAMRTWLSSSFGIPEAFITAEYGMTELSSQLYENSLPTALLGLPPPSRRLRAPPWVRATIVHPETSHEVPVGETGLVRLDDPANIDSVAAIQTADLARREVDGFVLLGRAERAVARGCSITADAMLLGAHS